MNFVYSVEDNFCLDRINVPLCVPYAKYGRLGQSVVMDKKCETVGNLVNCVTSAPSGVTSFS